MNNLRLILGGPGCGKTTRLLEIVEAELAAGVPAKRIAFVSFTKRATVEAQERAAKKFGLVAKDDLPWFRTIHSLAFARLGLQRDEVMGWKDWRDFADYSGYPLTGRYDADGVIGGGDAVGDQMLRVIDYATATQTSLPDSWAELEANFGWQQLEQFSAMLTLFKAETGKIDFGDMLVQCLTDPASTDVDVAIIDEAQDLTAIQWLVVRKAFVTAQRVYVAGDDDQAIYKWAGADVEQFLNLGVNARETLSQSHRLPRAVYHVGNRISARISRRYLKKFYSSDRDGAVEHHMVPDGIDMSSGTWLLLARNNYMLGDLEEMVRSYGVNYSVGGSSAIRQIEVAAMYLWEELRAGKRATVSAKEARELFKLLDMPRPLMKELVQYTPVQLKMPIERIWHEAFIGIPAARREYYISCLRRKEKLNVAPRVRISTIHGVKGAEADHVILMTDMSSRTARGYQANPDNEHRVFYVGATRARETLHIVAAQSGLSYQI